MIKMHQICYQISFLSAKNLLVLVMCFMVNQFGSLCSLRLWISCSCWGQQSITPCLMSHRSSSLSLFWFLPQSFSFAFPTLHSTPSTSHYNKPHTNPTCPPLLSCQKPYCVCKLNISFLGNKCISFCCKKDMENSSMI